MSDTQTFVGTRPVAEQHAFDIPALERWLAPRLPGFAGPLTVEMFKGGQSNPTYKLITPQRAYVMRAKPGPVARLLPSAHAIEREFRVMSALQGSGVPVAQMHVLCEDESVIGRAFYVMECVDGRVLWDQSLPGMDRAQRGAIYDEMNRVMAALHTDFLDRVGHVLDGDLQEAVGDLNRAAVVAGRLLDFGRHGVELFDNRVPVQRLAGPAPICR